MGTRAVQRVIVHMPGYLKVIEKDVVEPDGWVDTCNSCVLLLLPVYVCVYVCV